MGGVDGVLHSIESTNALRAQFGDRWFVDEESPRRGSQRDAVCTHGPSRMVRSSVVVGADRFGESIADWSGLDTFDGVEFAIEIGSGMPFMDCDIEFVTDEIA